MAYSFTGIAYLILFFALGYLVYRFFQYWRKEKDSVSKHSLFFIILFELFVLIKTIGGLFFATNPSFLEKTIDVGVFIQALTFAVIAYHITYLKFPKISPWFGFTPILILGLIATILTVITPCNPFLEPSGAINWGYPSSPLVIWMSILRFFLFAVTFIPLIIIFLSQFKISEDLYLKRKALGMSLLLLFILVGASFDFLFISIFKLGAIWRDIAFIVCSATLLITLILTLPPSSSKL
jgi:hypothetical protein